MADRERRGAAAHAQGKVLAHERRVMHGLSATQRAQLFDLLARVTPAP
jgi:hypothetical protein